MRPELLATVGTSLSEFIGRRVRMYTLAGEEYVGRLESTSEPFFGIDSTGVMERRGTYILTLAATGERYVGELPQLRTFDVLSG